MARRFIVKNSDIQKINDDEFEIIGEEVKHIQVLRHNVAEEIEINSSICKITKMSKTSISLLKIKEAITRGIPKKNITLIQAYLKSDKMEFVVEKSVELGVTKIIPVITSNVVVKLDENTKIKKRDKLNKISVEAVKQCGRSDMVTVEDIHTIDSKSLSSIFASYSAIIFAYEKEEKEKTLKKVITKIKEEESFKNDDFSIAVLVGAEGGFTNKEAEEISKMKNVYTVTLGERILRAETASIYILSALDYEL